MNGIEIDGIDKGDSKFKHIGTIEMVNPKNIHILGNDHLITHEIGDVNRLIQQQKEIMGASISSEKHDTGSDDTNLISMRDDLSEKIDDSDSSTNGNLQDRSGIEDQFEPSLLSSLKPDDHHSIENQGNLYQTLTILNMNGKNENDGNTVRFFEENVINLNFKNNEEEDSAIKNDLSITSHSVEISLTQVSQIERNAPATELKPGYSNGVSKDRDASSTTSPCNPTETDFVCDSDKIIVFDSKVDDHSDAALSCSEIQENVMSTKGDCVTVEKSFMYKREINGNIGETNFITENPTLKENDVFPINQSTKNPQIQISNLSRDEIFGSDIRSNERLAELNNSFIMQNDQIKESCSPSSNLFGFSDHSSDNACVYEKNDLEKNDKIILSVEDSKSFKVCKEYDKIELIQTALETNNNASNDERINNENVQKDIVKSNESDGTNQISIHLDERCSNVMELKTLSSGNGGNSNVSATNSTSSQKNQNNNCSSSALLSSHCSSSSLSAKQSDDTPLLVSQGDSAAVNVQFKNLKEINNEVPTNLRVIDRKNLQDAEKSIDVDDNILQFEFTGTTTGINKSEKFPTIENTTEIATDEDLRKEGTNKETSLMKSSYDSFENSNTNKLLLKSSYTGEETLSNHEIDPDRDGVNEEIAEIQKYEATSENRNVACDEHKKNVMIELYSRTLTEDVCLDQLMNENNLEANHEITQDSVILLSMNENEDCCNIYGSNLNQSPVEEKLFNVSKTHITNVSIANEVSANSETKKILPLKNRTSGSIYSYNDRRGTGVTKGRRNISSKIANLETSSVKSAKSEASYFVKSMRRPLQQQNSFSSTEREKGKRGTASGELSSRLYSLEKIREKDIKLKEIREAKWSQYSFTPHLIAKRSSSVTIHGDKNAVASSKQVHDRLYERAVESREYKEKVRQQIESHKMKDYTFVPIRETAKRNSKFTAALKPNAESVFDRLYFKAGQSSSTRNESSSDVQPHTKFSAAGSSKIQHGKNSSSFRNNCSSKLESEQPTIFPRPKTTTRERRILSDMNKKSQSEVKAGSRYTDGYSSYEASPKPSRENSLEGGGRREFHNADHCSEELFRVVGNFNKQLDLNEKDSTVADQDAADNIDSRYRYNDIGSCLDENHVIGPFKSSLSDIPDYAENSDDSSEKRSNEEGAGTEQCVS